MAVSSYICHYQFSHKINFSRVAPKGSCNTGMQRKSVVALKTVNSELLGRRVGEIRANSSNNLSFLGGGATIFIPNQRTVLPPKSSRVYASCLPTSQIASSVFTLGTVAVLPFYTLMILAPKSELTKRTVESSIPYIVLGVLYAYLLYLSWTPDTIRFMFASKHWLPELPGIAKMFSNEMTLASAWIHLLTVDLFAARQVYHDGMKNKIEMRHSVSLCLLFCPVGILTHFITKALTKSAGRNERAVH